MKLPLLTNLPVVRLGLSVTGSLLKLFGEFLEIARDRDLDLDLVA